MGYHLCYRCRQCGEISDTAEEYCTKCGNRRGRKMKLRGVFGYYYELAEDYKRVEKIIAKRTVFGHWKIKRW